jgi:NADP-dependent 3-hydroxy acid dehydrogenase YdfG
MKTIKTEAALIAGASSGIDYGIAAYSGTTLTAEVDIPRVRCARYLISL